jgi:hypothetical protein
MIVMMKMMKRKSKISAKLMKRVKAAAPRGAR